VNFSETFVRRPVMTSVLTLSVILFGILAYSRLPVNDLPAVDYPVIQVQADYPGASPETVANNIATPLERQFMQINGLELVTSKSTQGHTSITLQFDLNKSIDAAATDVQTAISQATGSLPVDLPSPPTFSKTNPNDQPIMYIPLVSDTATEGQLYDYANTQVGQRISILPGVSQVIGNSHKHQLAEIAGVGRRTSGVGPQPLQSTFVPLSQLTSEGRGPRSDVLPTAFASTSISARM